VLKVQKPSENPARRPNQKPPKEESDERKAKDDRPALEAGHGGHAHEATEETATPTGVETVRTITAKAATATIR